jgi:type I restriction enzyme S subunit
MKKAWQKLTLSDVCLRVGDGAHQSPASVEDGLPMASVKDLTPSGITIDTCRRISAEDFGRLARQGCNPQAGDVLIAKDGATALDTVCEIKAPLEVVLLSSVAILRPDKTKVLPSFLKSFLDAAPTRSYMKNAFTTGAAIPRVVLKDFKRVVIHLPPLDEQAKICGIICAYDDLIENNTRRIQILERMAQALYREWFVNLRFPGHAKVKLVPSRLGPIPESWEVVSIEEVCERVTDGSHSSPKSVDEGLPMASSKDMHEWGFTLATCRFISREDFNQLVRSDCKPKKNDILITKDGANYLKRIFVNRAEQEIVLLSSIAILRPNSRINTHLLAATLRSPENKTRLKNCVTGAAIPRIILKDFKRFQFVLPSRLVQTEWAKLCEPMAELCWRLVDKNQNLRRTRDLLLPKLISGALDVSKLDIETA